VIFPILYGPPNLTMAQSIWVSGLWLLPITISHAIQVSWRWSIPVPHGWAHTSPHGLLQNPRPYWLAVHASLSILCSNTQTPLRLVQARTLLESEDWNQFEQVRWWAHYLANCIFSHFHIFLHSLRHARTITWIHCNTLKMFSLYLQDFCGFFH
jgi:hypothetical protein